MAENNGPKNVGVDEIEEALRGEARIRESVTYDNDDIHQAALADNPVSAERPSWSTLLSIAVSQPPKALQSRLLLTISVCGIINRRPSLMRFHSRDIYPLSDRD